MRIVAGTLGSRRLKTLSGSTTRPTSDKTRAAIFSRLGPYFDGGSFLDVFGGSGAMAFEALSRGMAHATILEKDSQAFRIIRDNCNDLELGSSVKLIKGDSLNLISTLSERYDLVFVDPPYLYEKLEALLELLLYHNRVHDDGVLIVETGRKDLPEQILDWCCVQKKDYKTTQVYYYEKARVVSIK